MAEPAPIVAPVQMGSATAGHFDLQQRIARLLQKDLFFIGGYPKSGTTWLQVMLDAHPEIACRGEGHLTGHFARGLDEALQRHNALLRNKNATVMREFPPFPTFEHAHFDYLLVSAIALLLLPAGETPGVRMVGEKTPDNMLYLRLIERLLPRAKILNIVRDGRDCLVSAWFHNQRLQAEVLKGFDTIEAFVAHFATEWSRTVGESLAYGAAHPDRCLTVRYEDLAHHPREVLTGVLRFLGANTEAAAVQRCLATGAFEAMTGGRRRGEENRASLMRQGQPGNWRVHLSPAAGRAFHDAAGPVMAMLDYPR